MTSLKDNSSKLVRSLICHRDVHTALICLGSLVRYSTQPLKLVLHDDGSLTRKDQEILSQAFPGTCFISRIEADERMEAMLNLYPHARSFRKQEPLGLKLLDINLLAEEDVCYCDTDIMFFRPCTLYQWPDPQTAMLLMEDSQQAYSARPWHLLSFPKLRLPNRANTGLFMLRQGIYDLDYIEWFLGRNELRCFPKWVEQTALAALAFSSRCRMWNPQQVLIAHHAMELRKGIVAAHFVSPIRGLAPFYYDQLGDYDQDLPTVVSTTEPGECTPLALGISQLNRRLQTTR
jgi:hypothetical protein